MSEKIIYAVLRLNTEVETVNPLTGEKQKVKLAGCEGYIPVFKATEEAEKFADKGKYQIVPIEIGE